MDENEPNKRRKRGRHAAACTSCHRRKQKCDGARPCFNCTRRNVTSSCVYGEHVQRPKKADSEGIQRPVTPPPVIVHSEASRDRPPSRTTPTEGTLGTGSGNTPEPRDPPVGNLFSSRDAPSFFGSSYFGPQAAAKIIEAPAPDLSSGIRHAAGSAHSFRDVGGPFSQIWDLLGLLPRKKSSVDRLTECFLNDLNWAIDAVHPESFKAKYNQFWERKFGFDDFATIDLRWLALLFIVLAYGVLLDCPQPENSQVQRELQETSLRFYWASRRAIVIAPTFYGESTDLVRAGVLVTRYLIHLRRAPESWLTTSFAMRMAQAQGIHIDGERWRLSRKETETRRRLWSHLYMLDKTIALAIGRPFAIVDTQCLVKRATNVWLDDLSDEAASNVGENSLSDPTPSVCNFLAHDLATIIGKIQERCFGLFAVSYDTVLSLDQEIVEWEAKLPSYFRLQDPDLSLDQSHPFLCWNRMLLHSMYHFTRVTLHRPYLLRQSITNRFKQSHDACITSACADLDMRLRYLAQPFHDRLKWSLGPHHLFNSALVLGIIAVRDPHSRRSHAILEDLSAYCDMQRNDTWLNEFALAEVKIVELCIKKANDLRHGNLPSIANISTAPMATELPSVDPSTTVHHAPNAADSDATFTTPDTDFNTEPFLGLHNIPGGSGPFSWQTPWADPSFSLLESGDLQHWEQVLDSITQDQALFGVR
ncbi:hypothetical protein BU24DRAFT_424960 [Aaosphaeria arxii CBS 175.79]|uniref:Zn(2)-C6 fungal-type domain-containing protein n=1 Tax=Aaosphaeria arxii CBS 175.79 TaxID=1450172 RepID=A0A6A5XKX6_9PLEO|nr:uncharacterized protein BU24DRAFT_424960 [Aaosphaeria arxii CBS 175.79]KAF2013948.1 hypothetical protein BU24DRAFT_424960 [Aaosphaeria arxii CBS 175.79]